MNDRQDYIKRFIADCASRFIGTFFALVCAGLVFLIGLRFYVTWEAERIGNAIKQEMRKDFKSK